MLPLNQAPSTKHQAPSTKHQAPSTKHRKPFKGCTLSELLVSLGVLGLIAGLTVPSIINSVEKSKNKAMQKEAIQVISQIIQAGYFNGDFQEITNWDGEDPNSDLVQYFTKKLNAKHCPKGTVTEPCNHKLLYYSDVTNYHNNHSLRWVLPNGTQIMIPNSYYAKPWHFQFIIDSKPSGSSSFAVAGGDQIAIGCNPAETTSTGVGGGGWTYAGIKPGMCSAPLGAGWEAQYNALY